MASAILYSFLPNIISANAAFDMNRNMNGASGYVTTRIGSMSLGSPPLWLTRKGNDFFVNGAKIIFRYLQVGKNEYISSEL
mgnify:CR=1 FL=1